MKAKKSDWYKSIWSLDIKNQSWVEDTEQQVDFIMKTLKLNGGERILDLACGYGRHCLSFARKGFEVVGIDLTRDYIEDARNTAKEESLTVQFLCSDIRDIRYENEFDVVLNLADGAIGYLEDDSENLKIFDVISRALKPGGKHFMDVCNAEHAEHYFPKSNWETGDNAIALSKFEWDPQKRIMLFGGWDIPYDKPAKKPEILYGDPIRLYSIIELEDIFHQRNMAVRTTFSDYNGKKASPNGIQLMVYSEKLS
jgi:SAM-dependent methyltransferase